MAPPTAAAGHAVRQRLLDAALELIPERGWTAVSTRVLAERAGVTPSVVHYHFPSMSALLNEAATRLMRELTTELGSLLEAVETPAQAVAAMVTAVDRYTGVDPMSLTVIESYLAATRDDELRDQLRDLVAEVRQRLADWLAERGTPAPQASAAMLLAAVDGLLLHRGLGVDADAGAVTEVLRRLVAPPAPGGAELANTDQEERA